jgi:hypothetical protein
LRCWTCGSRAAWPTHRPSDEIGCDLGELVVRPCGSAPGSRGAGRPVACGPKNVAEHGAKRDPLLRCKTVQWSSRRRTPRLGVAWAVTGVPGSGTAVPRTTRGRSDGAAEHDVPANQEPTAAGPRKAFGFAPPVDPEHPAPARATPGTGPQPVEPKNTAESWRAARATGYLGAWTACSSWGPPPP